MGNKELCLAWLEWFKGWVAMHDICHSNSVLATTTKRFEYSFDEFYDNRGVSSCSDDRPNCIGFRCNFLFNFKFTDREVNYLYAKYRNEYSSYEVMKEDEDRFYGYVLSRLMTQITYGKGDFNLATMFAGNADTSWMFNGHGQLPRKTLRDIINEVHPNTFRDEKKEQN
jgi:hypothetical protein